MKGKIIYNGFWNSTPPNAVVRLIKSAKKHDLELNVFPNSEVVVKFDRKPKIDGFNENDFVIFWDKDMRLAKALEQSGIRLYNTSAAISLCDDKFATQLKLSKYDVPMPKTILAPMTYKTFEEPAASFYLNCVSNELGFPMIVKECFGSLGGQVYFAKSKEKLKECFAVIGDRPFFCQQFIPTQTEFFLSCDIRVYVVGGEVKAAMKRCHPSDFRANISNGGVGTPHIVTETEKALALKCAELLGLYFCGVDLLIDKAGNTFVCEVNSNAQMAGISRCTGINIADEIIEYVMLKEQKNS